MSLPILAVLALTATGCSSNDESPRAEKLCDGAVNSAAETALEEMTGTSSLSSRMGSSSHTPKELRDQALEWGTEGDPWDSSLTRWFCSVGAQDEEERLGVGASWSLVNFSYVSKEIEKGSTKYTKISPAAIIGKSENGRTDVYFPCQVSEGSKKSAIYTLEVDVSPELSKANDAQPNINKVLLSVARWMSHEVGCVNNPKIPASA